MGTERQPGHREDKKLVTFKYFFTRKLIFIRHSDAIALFPGGFGTMDEGYEALTLMQTGKSQFMPLVLVDRPGGTYWKTWDKHVREHLLRDELISPDDLNLYQITDNTDEAVKIITRFYRNFHSTRFVKDLLVIRLKHAPARLGHRRDERGFCRHHHRREDQGHRADPRGARGWRRAGIAPDCIWLQPARLRPP